MCLLNIVYPQVIHMHPASFPSSGGQLRISHWGRQAKSPGNWLNKFPAKFILCLTQCQLPAHSRFYLIVRPGHISFGRLNPPAWSSEYETNCETDQASDQD